MSWEPLASSNPVPGNPDVSVAAGAYYGDIAQAMADAYRALGVIDDMEGFESEAVEKLREKAEDVRGEVNKAEARYRAASEALTDYATHHQTAQDDALELLQRARAAQDAVEEDQRAANAAQTNLDDAVSTSRSSGQELDPETRTAVSNANSNLASSESALNGIIGELPGIVSTWRGKAGTAATKISDAVKADDLNDGMWEKWGKALAEFVSKWAGKLAMWAGIAALLLGWVPILGQVLAVLALVLTLVALVADIALVAHGDGDWMNVVLGVVAAASFGIGRVVGNLGRGIAKTAMKQGMARGARVAKNASRYGSRANRMLATNAWTKATSGFRNLTTTRNPVSWVRSGVNSFAGLKPRAWMMNAMGHTEAARAAQALRNANGIMPFARNATGYLPTLSNLNSLNPLRAGSIGSALVPFSLDVAGNATLLYRDVKTW